jgi:hypothetical protein
MAYPHDSRQPSRSELDPRSLFRTGKVWNYCIRPLYWKTIAACLPAAAAGAFYPVISEPVILAAYLLSWIACAATLVNDSNRSASALGGIFIWAIAAVSGAAAAGALAAHALWWWHQGYIAT